MLLVQPVQTLLEENEFCKFVLKIPLTEAYIHILSSGSDDEDEDNSASDTAADKESGKKAKNLLSSNNNNVKGIVFSSSEDDATDADEDDDFDSDLMGDDADRARYLAMQAYFIFTVFIFAD